MTERVTSNDPEETQMNAISYETPEKDWHAHPEEDTFGLPGRPRRQFFNRKSAALVAVIVGAVCFYAGVRVEKGQLSSSSSSASGAAGRAGAAGAAGAGARFAGAGAGVGAAARFAGAAGGFGGSGGGGATFGTVSSINHNTLYVTDATGNTVKVSLSPVTKVSKSVGVSRKAVRPGDTVVILGVKNSKGALIAASVSDSGARASGAGGGGGGAGGSGGGSGSSALGSLFGSGGGG
jgi:hypothetical protein